MFDIGFFELLIIVVVGLLVIGPERLPTTVRTVGLWIGRIKRTLTETRREIEEQLGADEIRRELRNEEIMRNLERMKDTRLEIEQRIKDWESSGSAEPQVKAAAEADKDNDDDKVQAQSALEHSDDDHSSSDNAPASAQTSEDGDPAVDHSAQPSIANKQP